MSGVRKSKQLAWLIGLGVTLGSFSSLTYAAEDSRIASQRQVNGTKAESNQPVANSALQQYRKVTAEVAATNGTAKRAEAKSDEIMPAYKTVPGVKSGVRQISHDQAAEPAGQHGAVHGPATTCTSGDCANGDCEGDCTTGDCPPECSIRDCLGCNFFSQNGWFVGAEYLYVTPHFSEPVAAVVRTTFIDDNNNSTITDSSQSYEFGYDSSYRVYGGYRWGSCGEAITFGYFNYGGNTSYLSPIADPGNGTIIAGALENNADSPGERLLANFDMNLNTYDLDYSKRITICSCNNDPCDCCDCPPWAITWSAGVRVADFERTEGNQLLNANGGVDATAEIETLFVGAGPKIGVEGRRYMGPNYRWSIFGKGSMALLLGDYDTTRTKVSGGGTITTIQTDNFRRVIPVTDIEVGFSRQIGQKTMFTAGYFFQAWWDLGMFEAIEGTNFGPEDDSNIMAFDGLMLRIERVF